MTALTRHFAWLPGPPEKLVSCSLVKQETPPQFCWGGTQSFTVPGASSGAAIELKCRGRSPVFTAVTRRKPVLGARANIPVGHGHISKYRTPAFTLIRGGLFVTGALWSLVLGLVFRNQSIQGRIEGATGAYSFRKTEPSGKRAMAHLLGPFNGLKEPMGSINAASSG